MSLALVPVVHQRKQQLEGVSVSAIYTTDVFFASTPPI